MPTTEPLLIIYNGQDITKHVTPGTAVSITNERPPRISSAQFQIHNGGDLGILAWRMMIICAPTLATTHFLGYVSRFTQKKRGIQLDYDIECSSIEVRLQKAVVNGTFTGTDAEILAALLAGTYPDLSDLFDFATDVTALSASDLTLDANNLNLMDAMNNLAEQVGADWSFDEQGAMRLNSMYNPALETINYWGGALSANGSKGAAYGAWDSGNVAWAVNYGETGGGLQITSQLLSGAYHTFFRWPRLNDSATHTIRGHNDGSGTQWIGISLRVRASSAGTYIDSGEILVYDGLGNYIKNRLMPVMTGTVSNVWSTISFVMQVESTWPENYALDFIFEVNKVSPNEAFTLNVDSILTEQLYGVAEPAIGAYFDGDTAGAMWAGAADGSASYLPATKKKLDWGATPPNAAFDIDIGTSSQIISDLEYESPSLDAINTVIVIGGAKYTEVVWEYPADNQLTHFDLEETVYPAAGATCPVVATNIGSDVSPNWSNLTVGDYDTGAFGGGVTVLYDKEDHWLYFQSAPPDLKRAFRVTGRIKQRIRATVQDENDVANTGITTADTIYNEAVTTEDEAFALGQAELDNRSAPISVRFTTYEPGLLPGAEVDIADTARGLSETLIIQRVQRKYLGGGYATFDVECGKREPGLDDVLAETQSLAEPKPPITASEIAATLQTLYDDSSLPLWDDDNQYLYQSV